MYKLSEDIVLNLKKKFPNADIENIIQYLFMEILQKTLNDGSSQIREFGKFISFATYSSKLQREVIRFKFKPSTALISKLNNDQYLLNNIPVKSKIPFNENHKQKCLDKKENKEINSQAQIEAERLGTKRTIKNVIQHDIKDLLDKKN